jgi:hypothetical protein
MVHTSTLIHSRFSYPYPSFLLQESRPHDDHIYVHVYIDVLHEYQVAEYADLGCTLSFACEYAKSNPHPYASDVRCVQLHSYEYVLIVPIIFWCGSWAPFHIIDPFKETAPRRLKLDRLC